MIDLYSLASSFDIKQTVDLDSKNEEKVQEAISRFYNASKYPRKRKTRKERSTIRV